MKNDVSVIWTSAETATLSSCCRGTCCLITTQPSSSSSSSLTGTNLSSFVCFFSSKAERAGPEAPADARLVWLHQLLQRTDLHLGRRGSRRGDNSSDVLFMSGRSQGQTDCFQLHSGVWRWGRAGSNWPPGKFLQDESGQFGLLLTRQLGLVSPAAERRDTVAPKSTWTNLERFKQSRRKSRKYKHVFYLEGVVHESTPEQSVNLLQDNNCYVYGRLSTSTERSDDFTPQVCFLSSCRDVCVRTTEEN